METFELRYFLAAAEHQSVSRAAARLSVSPPAISRAISRLEESLGVQLFERLGRNIVLSPQGKEFQREASRVVGALDELRLRFKPAGYQVSISLIGTEFGLSAFLETVLENLHAKSVPFSMEVKMADTSKEVERAILDGEAQIGIVTRSPSREFASSRLGRFQSKTFVGSGHPLYSSAKRKKTVGIEEVLRHDFVSFLEPVFSEAEGIFLSNDGWRDDQLKRRVVLRTESVEVALRAVESGRYLGYFPEPLGKQRSFLPLALSGCPYRCETEVALIGQKRAEYGWMRHLF
jgi:DNA-binding transcriptional LysR family regulator